jgi:CheY-like chemotaxis protein
MARTDKHTALVIDDDEVARRIMGDALEAEGFDVLTAADGTEGLSALIDHLLGLDLVVVDLHMPGLGGEELVRLVRGPGGERDLTIVVMSGDRDPALQRRLADAGADAVVAKAGGTATVAHAALAALQRHGRGQRPRC